MIASTLRPLAWLSILLIGGCSCGFAVTVAGSDPGEVSIFFEHATIDVILVRVSEVNRRSNEIVRWEVRGKMALEQLSYGESIESFTTVVGPTALRKGGIYRILVEADSGFLGPPCFGGGMFTIDSSDNAIDCVSMEDCQQFGK